MRTLLALVIMLMAGIASAQTETSIDRVLPEGSIAPEIRGIDPQGRSISSRKFKAAYVALLLFEPGTHPAESLLTELESLYRREHGPLLEFIAVALTSDSGLWKNHIARHSVGWIDLLPENVQQVRRDYRIQVLPTIYLIDRKHRIRSPQLLRSDDLELRWFELYNEL